MQLVCSDASFFAAQICQTPTMRPSLIFIAANKPSLHSLALLGIAPEACTRVEPGNHAAHGFMH